MSNGTVTFDTGIPVPKIESTRKVIAREKLATINVGESFAIDRRDLSMYRIFVRDLKKTTSKIFIIRKTDDDEWRLWRTQ